MEKETWKPVLINGESTYYQISNFGRIRSNYKGDWKIRSFSDNGHGYCCLTLSLKGHKYTRKIHRLVAQAFISNPDNLPEVNHIDTNKKNNHYKNLIWATKPENAKHAGKMGLMGRGCRKLPPKPIAQFNGQKLIKQYISLGEVKKYGYPRISVTRAAESGRPYKGFNWKFI